MDNDDILNLNRDVDNLISCLDEYSKSDDSENKHNVLNSSMYYNDNEILNFMQCTTKNNYKVMHLNIQSLPSKFCSLQELVDNFETNNVKLDFILLCETFLHSGNSNLFQLQGYTFVCRNRSNMARGGVAIYIRDEIEFTERRDLEIYVEGEFESIFIEIENSGSLKPRTVVGEIYRVPNSNPETSIERYDEVLMKLKDTSNVIIGTDQNFDLLKINTQKHTANLYDTMFSNQVIPTITKPTRFTSHSATLIDNIYIKYNPKLEIDSAILVDDISDHLPVFCLIKHCVRKPVTKEPLIFYKRRLNDKSINIIKETLDSINWDYLDYMPAESTCDNFINKLNKILDTYAPLKKTTIPRKHIIRVPWLRPTQIIT